MAKYEISMTPRIRRVLMRISAMKNQTFERSLQDAIEVIGEWHQAKQDGFDHFGGWLKDADGRVVKTREFVEG